MIDRKNVIDQPVKNYRRTHEVMCKNMASQRDFYTTGCILDYVYFKDYFKIIAIDLCKEQVVDAEQKAIQQTSFTGNLDQAENTTMFFIFQCFSRSKINYFDFSRKHYIFIFFIKRTSI